MTDISARTPGSFLGRNRDFRRFLGASLLVDAAVQIEAVTIGWQIYALARETRSVEESALLVGMVGLAAGVVDVKVCAIDHEWSGLKLVIRRELR